MPHPDLPGEQAYLDRAYERLEALRAQAQGQLKAAFRERGGTFQSFTERDIKVRSSLVRLEKLELGSEALIFGRIDRDGEGEHAGEGESFHIGRLAISDSRHEPLVVDWRAPVAEPFYRATGAHPMGLRRRRHFLTDGRLIVDLEDELFATGTGERAAETLGLAGPHVLRAALERAHTGRMRDIVATVQAEQDEVIRAALPGVLVVQGGPGTGKTAVALHRAAYLLYTHRFPLESQGVLVVGPNPTFLRYIDQVLPSLGETGVEFSTATGLYKGARPRAGEAPEVARLKGDPRMAQVVRRAVRQRERPVRKTVQVPYGRVVLTLSPEASSDIVSSARRRAGGHNARRRYVEAGLWQHLADQLNQRAAGNGAVPVSGSPSGGGPGPRTGDDDHGDAVPLAGFGGDFDEGPGGDVGTREVKPTEVRAHLRRRSDIVELLERMWPRLSPEAFLHDLFGARPLVGQAARGLLSEAEAALLYRPRSSSVQEVRWTAADMALLDEASWWLGADRPEPKPVNGGGAAAVETPGKVRSYGHIVVDEAQDLTPMELRMVGRRSLSGSMTLVGDIAQATGPWAPSSWEELVRHLPSRRGWRAVDLSVSYRAPAEVMEVAARVLAAALPGTVPPEPVRQTGHPPRVISVQDAVLDGGGRALGDLVARTVAEEVAAVAGAGGAQDGNVGVLVPDALLTEVRAGLLGSGVAFGEVGAGALDLTVSLLVLNDAKGLEFDAVVVVEPAAIISQSVHGMRALYVALTRCTRRLAIVHRQPLPAPIV